MENFRKSISILLATASIGLIASGLRANDPTVQSLAASARPLGTFVLGATTTSGCPTGFSCNSFTVATPGVLTNASGIIADMKPPGAIKGVLMFFSGGDGTTWWQEKSVEVSAFFQSLLNAGFELVQVQWSGGWLVSPVGVKSGQEALACRPATVIKWVHDNIYAPLGLHPNIGQCGFCITGNSAGASQITYALSTYGIDSFVNAAIPSSGPPMAGIAKGCLQQAGYAYNSFAAQLMDESYGFSASLTGPCVLQDSSFTNTWIANSVETGGTNYNYPTTRIHFILGGGDSIIIPNHANLYFQVLVGAKQPMLTWETVPGMGHEIMDSVDGLAALFDALTRNRSRSVRKRVTLSITRSPARFVCT